MSANPNVHSDQAIIEAAVRAIQTEPKSEWDELARATTTVAKRVARGKYNMSDADADDVAQEVLIKLLVWIDRIDEPAAAIGWITTTSSRACLRLLTRGAGAREESSADFETIGQRPLWSTEGLAADPAERVAQRDLEDRLHSAVDDLPEARRELGALMLDPTEPSYADIADTLGRPIGWIGPTRARLCESLRAVPGLSAA